MTATLPPALAIKGLVKSYLQRDGKRLVVLDGLDLEIAPGQIQALVGPSGCGKTTLLHIVTGLIGYDAGHVAVRGVPFGVFADWRSIGYVFQDDRLLPWRTALDNVALALESLPIDRQTRRARSREMLAMMGLSAFAHAYPHELSGGMRSRVALARSMVINPDLLAMDEPFTGLDWPTRETLYADLLRMRDNFGTTILLVTHDAEEAAILANEVVVLTPRPCTIQDRVTLTGQTPRDGADLNVITVCHRIKQSVKAGFAMRSQHMI